MRNKDSNTFWKMWKTKFWENVLPTTIDDFIDDCLDLFSNKVLVDADLKAEIIINLLDRLKEYDENNFEHESITVEMVSILIDKLKRGEVEGI